MTKTIAIGDSLKAIGDCAQLPVGTIVAFTHPVYQMTKAAVRTTKDDGSLYWEVSGRSGKQKTRTIKQAYGWAPFKVLWLPDEPLNTVDGEAK